MKVGELLGFLTRDRIDEVARAFDVDNSGNKGDVISRVARSLARRNDDRGQQLGVVGALKAVVPLLTGEDLIKIFNDTYWYSPDDVAYQTVTSRLRTLRVADLRELLLGLSLSEEGDGYPTPTQMFADSRFADIYVSTEEDEDSSSEEAPFEEMEAAGEESWQLEDHYVVDGLSPLDVPENDKPLFPHQENSVVALRRWWDGDQRAGVLCLPTGAGKTRTTISFLLRHVLAQPDAKVLWLAHRHELVNQAVKSLLENRSDRVRSFRIGRYEAQTKYEERDADIIVASIPTVTRGEQLPHLRKLLKYNRSFDLVVVDECHHAVAKSWKNLLKKLGEGDQEPKFRKLLGLSATPTRTAETERPQFWRLFDRIIHEERLLPLIQAGILARPNMISLDTQRSFVASAQERRLFEQFGDLPTSLQKTIANDDTRNKVIVRAYLEQKARWGQTLLFAGTVDQSISLCKKLQQAGVDARHLDASSSKDERSAVIEAFKKKLFPVLVNVALFTEGTDLPAVETVFLARPTRSDILFQQMVGRGLRGPKLGGTQSCNVVVFHDATLNLMQTQLSSGFSSQRDALAALGIPDEEETALLPPVAHEDESLVANAIDERKKSSLLSQRAAEFALRLADLGSRALPHFGEEFPLIGWWQSETTSHVSYLPVLANDAAAAGARVGQLLAAMHTKQPLPTAWHSPLQWISEEMFHGFATAASNANAPPRYVPLDLSAAGAARDLLGALSDATCVAPKPPVAPPTDWLGEAARKLNAVASGHVLLSGNAGPISMPEDHHSKLRGTWDRFKPILSPTPTAEAVQAFLGLIGHTPDVQGIAPETVRKVFASAATTGSFPEPVKPLEGRPSFSELRTILGATSVESRRQVVGTLHRAYFGDSHPSESELLMDLACASS